MMAWLLSRRDGFANMDANERKAVEQAIVTVELGFDTAEILKQHLKSFCEHVNTVDRTARSYIDLCMKLQQILLFLIPLCI